MLYNYQKSAINQILDKKKCALFIPMGYGKSVISLAAFNEAKKRGEVKKALVIAPLMVARLQWHKEISKWSFLSHLSYSLILGSEKNRNKAIEADSDIYIINRENIKWLIFNSNFDFNNLFLIIDESTSFKNAYSERFKCLKKKSSLAKYTVLLSAIPAANSYRDLWSQFFLLDNGKRLGYYISHFLKKYFNLINPVYYTYTIKPESVKIINKLTADLRVVLPPIKGLQIPDRIDINIDIPFSHSRTEELYTKLKKKFYDDLGEEEITINNIATASLKMRQLCSGFMYDSNKQTLPIHTDKINYLKELIESIDTCIVVYNFQAEKEMLLSSIEGAVLFKGEEDQINDWNNKKIKVLLIHPASAGAGLNLQHGGSIMIFYSLNYSYEQHDQIIGRIHRQGQKEKVRIYYLLIEKSIEHKIQKILFYKNKINTSFLESIL